MQSELTFISAPAGLFQLLKSHALRSPLMIRQRSSPWRCCISETRLVSSPDGGTLSVDIYNAKTGPRAALLLHDFMTDKRLFRHLATQSCFRDCMLIVPDMRGFGSSSSPDKPYSRTADLQTILQNVAPSSGRIDVVGSGLGGTVALNFALESSSFVRSVSLLASGLPGHAWSTDKLFMDISAARLAGRLLQVVDGRAVNAVEEGTADMVKWKRSFIASNETWSNVLRSGDKRVAQELLDMARDYRAFHFFYDDPLRPNALDNAPLIDQIYAVLAPVLVMVGEKDTKDFRQIAQEIWERVPKPEDAVFMIGDAGHFLSLEKPDVVAEELLRFWKAVDE